MPICIPRRHVYAAMRSRKETRTDDEEGKITAAACPHIPRRVYVYDIPKKREKRKRPPQSHEGTCGEIHVRSRNPVDTCGKIFRRKCPYRSA